MLPASTPERVRKLTLKSARAAAPTARMGSTVMAAPQAIQVRPGPTTRVSTKWPPAFRPTAERNSEMPTSRSTKLAESGRYQTSGPSLPRRATSSATSSGPPASPSLSGAGMPGSTKGQLPSATPATMPTNIGTRCG